MNFLWDVVIRAVNQGKKEEDLFFMQAEEYSPFYEQAFPCLNMGNLTDNTIELNLLYRYSDIFQGILFQLMQEESTDFGKYLIDAALHTLLYTDLRYGMTKREIYVRKLLGELKNGNFWSHGADNFRHIERQEQIWLASLMLTQIQIGSSLHIFRRSLLVVFPNAILYQVKDDKKKLLLYLQDSKTEKKERSLRFVQDMFLPISYRLRVFWEFHFGIIGVEAAMKIGETVLY